MAQYACVMRNAYANVSCLYLCLSLYLFIGNRQSARVECCERYAIHIRTTNFLQLIDCTHSCSLFHCCSYDMIEKYEITKIKAMCKIILCISLESEKPCSSFVWINKQKKSWILMKTFQSEHLTSVFRNGCLQWRWTSLSTVNETIKVNFNTKKYFHPKIWSTVFCCSVWFRISLVAVATATTCPKSSVHIGPPNIVQSSSFIMHILTCISIWQRLNFPHDRPGWKEPLQRNDSFLFTFSQMNGLNNFFPFKNDIIIIILCYGVI